MSRLWSSIVSFLKCIIILNSHILFFKKSMNIRLNHKSEFYELFVNNRQIVFVLEEIRSIKIKKKLNFKYIICFLLLVSGLCLLVLQFFMFSFFGYLIFLYFLFYCSRNLFISQCIILN